MSSDIIVLLFLWESGEDHESLRWGLYLGLGCESEVIRAVTVIIYYIVNYSLVILTAVVFPCFGFSTLKPCVLAYYLFSYLVCCLFYSYRYFIPLRRIGEIPNKKYSSEQKETTLFGWWSFRQWIKLFYWILYKWW